MGMNGVRKHMRLELRPSTAGTPATQQDRTVKIAIATPDGRTVGGLLGRATRFLVVTVDHGAIVGREVRAAPKFRAPRNRPARPARVAAVLAPITDCGLVVALHIGWRAREEMSQLGMTPIVTDRMSVDDAAAECAAGRIVSIARPLH